MNHILPLTLVALTLVGCAKAISKASQTNLCFAAYTSALDSLQIIVIPQEDSTLLLDFTEFVVDPAMRYGTDFPYYYTCPYVEPWAWNLADSVKFKKAEFTKALSNLLADSSCRITLQDIVSHFGPPTESPPIGTLISYYTYSRHNIHSSKESYLHGSIVFGLNARGAIDDLILWGFVPCPSINTVLQRLPRE